MSMKHYIRKIVTLEDDNRSLRQSLQEANRMLGEQLDQIKELEALNRSQELTIAQFRGDD